MGKCIELFGAFQARHRRGEALRKAGLELQKRGRTQYHKLIRLSLASHPSIGESKGSAEPAVTKGGGGAPAAAESSFGSCFDSTEGGDCVDVDAQRRNAPRAGGVPALPAQDEGVPEDEGEDEDLPSPPPQLGRRPAGGNPAARRKAAAQAGGAGGETTFFPAQVS